MELPFELVYTPKELDLNEFPEMRDVKDSPILATAIMEGIFGTILKMNKCKVRRES